MTLGNPIVLYFLVGNIDFFMAQYQPPSLPTLSQHEPTLLVLEVNVDMMKVENHVNTLFLFALIDIKIFGMNVH